MAYPNGITWTNMPLALTPFLGASSLSNTVRVDLSNATQFRIIATVVNSPAVNAALRVRDLDDAVDLATVTGDADCFIAQDTTFAGPWATIRVASRTASRAIALYGLGGNATADPVFVNVRMEYR